MSDNGRILVIDDEPGIREGCRRLLGAAEYQVDTAENGKDALQKIQNTGYDVILLDVMMPDVSGIDLIQPIHDRDPDTVCIVITGYATVELAVAAIKQGAYDFINKPFTADDLTLAVRQGIERRRLSLESKRCAAAEERAARLDEDKKRLEEIDRAKMAFVRMVTHELRAPVAAIQSYMRLILEGYVPPERQPEIIARAELRAREELQLIADLLELSRLQNVPARSEAGSVDPAAVLQDVIEQFEGQSKEKNQQLLVDVQCLIPSVLMVPGHMKSVWTNLVSNAIKYTPVGGKVSISLNCDDETIVGQVTDTGIGISPEDQERLFTEFFRTENARMLPVPGTGLGLAIVKEILENAGGSIRVRSAEGQGSTFTFTLPVNRAPAE